MKLSNLYATLLCLLVASASVNAAVLDWTQPQTAILNSNKCIEQIKDLKLVWTGDCEGSYAAMVASTLQDRICIEFDKKTVTNVELKKLSDIKVSYTDLICRCEICHQHSGKGCRGGKLFETLKFLKDEGFVGGSKKDNTADISITGDIWKPTFKWNYTNCLGYFKSYCVLGSNGTDKCTDTNNPTFNKDTHCAKKATSGTGFVCPNKESVDIKNAVQKTLFKSFNLRSGRNNMKAALNDGPLVSYMEIRSDIFFHPKDKPYIPRAGGSLGYFAVKIVGYVETSASTPPQGYWKVMMPFDLNIGDQGIVWIQAGLNIGDIEANAYSLDIETDLLKPPTP